MINLSQAKKKARKDARLRRKSAITNGAPEALIDNFPANKFPGVIVSGFWPIKNEIDIRPLLQRLHEAGHELCLPCTPPAGNPLIFRTWTPGDDLRIGDYDTREPFERAPEIFPTLLLMPLLAFTASGERLGYGGGFYDRTLDKLRARGKVFACGVAFAGQEASEIPTDAYDQRLDGILTEKYFKEFA